MWINPDWDLTLPEAAAQWIIIIDHFSRSELKHYIPKHANLVIANCQTPNKFHIEFHKIDHFHIFFHLFSPALESCTSSWYSSSSSAFVLDGTPPMAATAVPHLGSLGTIRSCRRWVELKELQLTPKKIQDIKPLRNPRDFGDSTHRKFIKWPSWVMNKRKLTSHRVAPAVVRKLWRAWSVSYVSAWRHCRAGTKTSIIGELRWRYLEVYSNVPWRAHVCTRDHIVLHIFCIECKCM